MPCSQVHPSWLPVAFCPPDFCLDSQTAGVANKSLPFHQPILHLTTLELAHCIFLRCEVFPEFLSAPFSINVCLTEMWPVNMEMVKDATGQTMHMNYWRKKSICVPSSVPYIYIDTLLHNIAGLLMLTAASRQKIRGPAADAELCRDTESASEDLYCIPSPTFLPWCFVCPTVITFQRNYEYTTLQLRTICHVQPYNTSWGT